MKTQELLDPKDWAERTFGGVQLHDLRRTRRTVQAATRLAEHPLGSLPAQLQTWKATKSRVPIAERAGCHLCGLDAAARSANQSTSQCCTITREQAWERV